MHEKMADSELLATSVNTCLSKIMSIFKQTYVLAYICLCVCSYKYMIYVYTLNHPSPNRSAQPRQPSNLQLATMPPNFLVHLVDQRPDLILMLQAY